MRSPTKGGLVVPAHRRGASPSHQPWCDNRTLRGGMGQHREVLDSAYPADAGGVPQGHRTFRDFGGKSEAADPDAEARHPAARAPASRRSTDTPTVEQLVVLSYFAPTSTALPPAFPTIFRSGNQRRYASAASWRRLAGAAAPWWRRTTPCSPRLRSSSCSCFAPATPREAVAYPSANELVVARAHARRWGAASPGPLRWVGWFSARSVPGIRRWRRRCLGPSRSGP